MAIDVILCIGPTTCTTVGLVCFVLPSCCTTGAGDPIGVRLYAELLPTIDTTPASQTLLSPFGRAATSKLWPIRHWGGSANSNP